MANSFDSGWAEDAVWGSHCQAAAISTDVLSFPAAISSLSPPPLPPDEDFLFGYPAFPPNWSKPFEGEDDRATSASRSHSEAEKRRRDRINAQLATLRKLIPKSEKMDKAALLGSVVEHVRDLKTKAKEIGKVYTVPTDTDEVTIDCFKDEEGGSSSSSSGNIFIRASVCCEDRPDLFSELNRAIKGLRLTTVQADVTSLGGRTKTIFLLCANGGLQQEDQAGGNNINNCMMNTIKQSLKVVLTRIATSSSTSSYRIKSKRQKFFLHPHHH